MTQALVCIPQQNVIPFHFQERTLVESCHIDGEPYFTRRAIGEFLAYANPKKAVEKLINRTPHLQQFCRGREILIVAPDGKKYKTVVYPIRETSLIIYESRQPNSLFAKVWAAALTEAHALGKLQQPPLSLTILAQEKPWARGFGQKLLEAGKTEAHFKNVKGQIGISAGVAYRRIRRIREGKPVNGGAPGLVRFTWKRHRHLFEQVAGLKRQGLRGRAIAELLGLPRSTAFRWVKKVK